MHHPILPATLLATAATALPNSVFFDRPTGAVNWYERYDCTSKCVETSAVCPNDKKYAGAKGSVEGMLTQGHGCWDRPDGVHSLGLTVDSGECCAHGRRDVLGRRRHGFREAIPRHWYLVR